jgi:hypothetical protein
MQRTEAIVICGESWSGRFMSNICTPPILPELSSYGMVWQHPGYPINSSSRGGSHGDFIWTSYLRRAKLGTVFKTLPDRVGKVFMDGMQLDRIGCQGILEWGV